MKDIHKNTLAMILIGIIVSIIVHYFDIDAWTFPILIGAVALWLMITPFKMYDDAT